MYDLERSAASNDVETKEETGSEDDSGTGKEYDSEDLASFSLSYPFSRGFKPVLIGTGFGMVYGFVLVFVYLAFFLLWPFTLMGFRPWPGPGTAPTLSVTATLTMYVGYISFWLISFLPLYPVAGYYVKLTEHAAKGEPKPPKFKDFTNLFLYGIKSILLIVVPLSLLISVMYVGMELVIELVASGSVAEVGVGTAYVLSYLVWLYLAPGMLVNYSLNQDLGDAYDLENFREFALNTTYPLYYLGSLVLVVTVFVSLVSITFISFFTIIGVIILVPASFFICFAMIAAFWGRVYYKTLPETN